MIYLTNDAMDQAVYFDLFDKKPHGRGNDGEDLYFSLLGNGVHEVAVTLKSGHGAWTSSAHLQKRAIQFRRGGGNTPNAWRDGEQPNRALVSLRTTWSDIFYRSAMLEVTKRGGNSHGTNGHMCNGNRRLLWLSNCEGYYRRSSARRNFGEGPGQ